jgi:hypothetical protein
MLNAAFSVGMIRRARKNRNNDLLTAEEVGFVINDPELTSNEKLLWLDLACVTVTDPDLTCAIPLENMEHYLNGTEDQILPMMFKLRQRGLLEVAMNVSERDAINVKNARDWIGKIKSLSHVSANIYCTVVLPPRGLKAILKVPPFNYSGNVEPKIKKVKKCNWFTQWLIEDIRGWKNKLDIFRKILVSKLHSALMFEYYLAAWRPNALAHCKTRSVAAVGRQPL